MKKAVGLAVVAVVLALDPTFAASSSSVEGVSVSQLGSCSGSNLGELKAVNDSNGATSGVCTSSGGAVRPGACQCNGASWIVASVTGEVTYTEVSVSGKLVSAPQEATCDDSEDENAGALTLIPTANVVLISNDDADGCDVTMSETGAEAGHVVFITVLASAGGTVDFADSAGVSELSGALTLGAADALVLGYNGAAWVQFGTVNN